jgi:heme exporter protein A
VWKDAFLRCLIYVNGSADIGLAPAWLLPTIALMLHGINLACVRGERPLFSGIDLAVDGGQWLHVRGANGVGKTSLLRLLAGLSQPAEGQVRWHGEPIADCAGRYRANLLYLGHQGALKDDLTALENIELAGALDGSPAPRAVVGAALRRFGLQGREELPVRVLSAGQKRRVLLARLLTRRATLWVLDEPFTALDAKAVGMLSDLLAEHVAQGGMAVVTSHQPVPIAGGRAVDL